MNEAMKKQTEKESKVLQIINSIDEDDLAESVIWALFTKFGFSGTWFSLVDIESRIDRELTPSEFDTLINSEEWNNTLPDLLGESGFDYITEMLKGLGIKEDDQSYS